MTFAIYFHITFKLLIIYVDKQNSDFRGKYNCQLLFLYLSSYACSNI